MRGRLRIHKMFVNYTYIALALVIRAALAPRSSCVRALRHTRGALDAEGVSVSKHLGARLLKF